MSETRRIVARTRGLGRGGIVRLMSPSDLGRLLKPFVFLDLFAFHAREVGSMPIHPHSGIATVTLLTEGDLHFDDADAGTGAIGYGGVEWMRAGKGVWHGQEMYAGSSASVRGFQLWIALPPDLETGSPDSQYIEADHMPIAPPATVILGRYEGVQSPVRAPPGITYLLVTLQPGENWRFQPPEGQGVAFLAVSRGSIQLPEPLSEGELAVLEPGLQPVQVFASGDAPAVFVMGAAQAHGHELHLGYHSVHTSAAALALGERHIAELGLRRQGGAGRQTSGATPILR